MFAKTAPPPAIAGKQEKLLRLQAAERKKKVKTATQEKTFAFKSGFPNRGTDPQQVGEFLERLNDQHGMLTTEIILAAAEDEDSPIHAIFEWDDTEAARLYRLDQASAMIRAVVVVHENRPPVRRFVHVYPIEKDGCEGGGRGYVGLEEALREPAYCRQLLDEAYSELRHFRTKYDTLKELAGVHAAIDAVVPMET